jgi:adenosylcobinamide amidohydrolase
METKNLRKSLSAIAMTFFIAAFSLTSCQKDNSGGSGTASTAIKITDAPIDDASVSGAFVTITDIKLDGQSVQGFTKTTVDLNAYQNGATRTLGNFSLEGRTYSSITFVLDFDMDASGNAPGCYVLAGAVKHKLQSTANSITISKGITLVGGASNSIVADFDLRKMIIHQSGGPSDHFDFATAAELQSSVRIVAESSTGTISGTVTDAVSGSGKVVAYVYKKGTFNRLVEMQGQGTSSIEFKNAVSSALVSGTGSYQLHFLESGDYEIYFASYKDTNVDGEFELKGTLIATGAGGLDLLGLKVNVNATLKVDVTVTGVLL